MLYDHSEENTLDHFVLFSENGKFLTFDPHSDTYTEVDSVSNLKIWDYQHFSEEDLWFMGNTARPKIDFTVKKLPVHEVEKLR